MKRLDGHNPKYSSEMLGIYSTHIYINNQVTKGYPCLTICWGGILPLEGVAEKKNISLEDPQGSQGNFNQIQKILMFWSILGIWQPCDIPKKKCFCENPWIRGDSPDGVDVQCFVTWGTWALGLWAS